MCFFYFTTNAQMRRGQEEREIGRRDTQVFGGCVSSAAISGACRMLSNQIGAPFFAVHAEPLVHSWRKERLLRSSECHVCRPILRAYYEHGRPGWLSINPTGWRRCVTSHVTLGQGQKDDLRGRNKIKTRSRRGLLRCVRCADRQQTFESMHV